MSSREDRLQAIRESTREWLAAGKPRARGRQKAPRRAPSTPAERAERAWERSEVQRLTGLLSVRVEAMRSHMLAIIDAAVILEWPAERIIDALHDALNNSSAEPSNQ